MYDIILYYNFQSIKDPEQFCLDHKAKCLELDLLGRIYIASEGINGTLAGVQENIHKYKEYLQSLSGFEGTEFKEDQCDVAPTTAVKYFERDSAQRAIAYRFGADRLWQ